jgi:hypothetical protein
MSRAIVVSTVLIVGLLGNAQSAEASSGAYQWEAITANCKILVPWGGLVDPSFNTAQLSALQCPDGLLSGPQRLKLHLLAGKPEHRWKLLIDFQANFVAGKATGKGHFRVCKDEPNPYCSLVYFGEFADGLADGNGQLLYNGFYYQVGRFRSGIFIHGKKGFALSKFSEEGDFNDKGDLEGPSTVTLKNGSKITGTYLDGHLSGYGLSTHTDGTTSKVIQDSHSNYVDVK